MFCGERQSTDSRPDRSPISNPLNLPIARRSRFTSQNDRTAIGLQQSQQPNRIIHCLGFADHNQIGEEFGIGQTAIVA